MSPVDAGGEVGVVVVGVVVVGVVVVGVVVVGVVVVGVVVVGAGTLEVGFGCDVFFVDCDFLMTASTLMRFPAMLRFPAASLAAPVRMVATMVPGLFTPATVTLKLLRLPRLATFTLFALAVPESLTPAAEKPRTDSLKETVKRTADCEVGLD